MSATIHDHAAGADPKPQRDARGRFARGNSGGPGNPFGRRLAQLREFLLRSATEQNVERLANMLMEKAFAGDMAAAKLLLLYWIGKPKEVVEPDRVDVEEWELATEHVVPPHVAQETFASMPITVGIAGLSGMAVVHETLFTEGLHDPEKFQQRLQDTESTDEELAEEAEMVREMRAARGEAATPSTIASQATAPAPRPMAERGPAERTPPKAKTSQAVHRHQSADSVELGGELDLHKTSGSAELGDQSDRHETADSAASAAPAGRPFTSHESRSWFCPPG
jgi:hypothetical protein